MTYAQQQQLNGVSACIRVRSVQTRLLPPAQSEERNRLEELVRQSGLWDQLSQLSRPKLEHALTENSLPAAQADAIGELCPLSIVHQVSSRALTSDL